MYYISGVICIRPLQSDFTSDGRRALRADPARLQLPNRRLRPRRLAQKSRRTAIPCDASPVTLLQFMGNPSEIIMASLTFCITSGFREPIFSRRRRLSSVRICSASTTLSF